MSNQFEAKLEYDNTCDNKKYCCLVFTYFSYEACSSLPFVYKNFNILTGEIILTNFKFEIGNSLESKLINHIERFHSRQPSKW